MGNESKSWYAIRVRSRCEKLASEELRIRGFCILPAIAPQRRVWADRIRVVKMPLFPGYIFGQFRVTDRVRVESSPGVASVVRFGPYDAPIDPEEIDAVRLLAGSGQEVMRTRSLPVGSRVRVSSGPLKGAQGFLVEMKNRFQLVVSVSILQRSVAVEIDEAMVEVIPRPSRVGAA
jgi:transcription antitermination factor NusG